ncbi:PREDICTED: radial spoke head 1 homolog, partial [Tinamus guttatus]|uniref:radial spoke head 1 homolog n=1 Tax=Tinamus guttatus TaxID=94827 RepID=UPI00052F3983
HGQGTYIYKESGSKYVGGWTNGNQGGAAELIHLNHRFQGMFLHGYPIGHGKYVFDSGCEQRGEYIHPEPVKETGEEEEEEHTLLVPPKWKATDITKVTLWTPTEEQPASATETSQAAAPAEEGTAEGAAAVEEEMPSSAVTDESVEGGEDEPSPHEAYSGPLSSAKEAEEVEEEEESREEEESKDDQEDQ